VILGSVYVKNHIIMFATFEHCVDCVYTVWTLHAMAAILKVHICQKFNLCNQCVFIWRTFLLNVIPIRF